MAMESAIFSQSSPIKFSNTDPSNQIVSRFTHFKQPFSLYNQKNKLFHHIKDHFHCISTFTIFLTTLEEFTYNERFGGFCSLLHWIYSLFASFFTPRFQPISKCFIPVLPDVFQKYPQPAP